ncbi:hypothetical protein LDL79_10975 [Leeuwenhoekiella palythoae]|uniref:Uncharacterized protein n=1 Tax=Galbibacter orientalis DSM 19592 TaxID=926559 RepID=I3C8F2_9FLAO|nr:MULTISPECIES: hypothetical protein [Flavobacteriaceae]EIJ39895.1 hypothetical protein JoomaDRAFT_2937 [Galbibacter orientalis DSM 19592]UBZ09321.1 hypothetical protein LDL79_10975 [Leeuwenhoekiella palythoae]
MDWMFEDFKSDLDSLDPRVREKALEIAGQLVKEKNYMEKKAISEAIVKAEEWFYDLGG